MSKMKVVQSSRRGFVMALALFLVVIFLITGVGLLGLGLNARVYAVRTADSTVARVAADAGLEKAISVMNRKLEAGWDDSVLPRERDMTLSNCEGTFSYIVTQAASYLDKSITREEYDADIARYVSSVTPGPTTYVVKAVGRCAQSERTVYATLRLQGCGEYGVLVLDFATLKSGTLVDGINTSDLSIKNVPIEIGTASTLAGKIVLNNGVVVDGSVLVGVGGNPDVVIKDLGAETGIRCSLPEEPYFPSVTAPSLPKEGAITAHGQTIRISPADSGKYKGITLKRAVAPAILEITGGEVVLHVTGDINMGEGCEIKISKGSSLSLYVDGDILASEDSGFNNEGVPADFELWGTAKDEQRFQLNAKSEYFGQLYAPNATVTVAAKGDLYGAFTAEKFEMKAGGNLFYDGALRDVDHDDEGVRFVLERWYEW